MPNRNLEGDYRYGYQGEYAEKEPELGNGQNSFELRLWDSRIGRWLSPDPYNEFHSPYLGMGNNPISRVDPDGGMDCPNPPCGGHQPPGTEAMNSNLPIDQEVFGTENWHLGGELDEVLVQAPSKISFKTMNDKQIINLAIDWFAFIEENERKADGTFINIIDMVSRGARPQGDRIDRFFGSMTVSSLEASDPSNDIRFGVTDGSLVSKKSSFGDIGEVRLRVLRMDGYKTEYVFRTKTPDGRYTNSFIITKNKETYERIHSRIYPNK